MKLYEFKDSTFTKRETVTDMPEGIAVTLPEAWFKDFDDGELAFWRAMERVDKDEDYLWHQTISGIPKIEVPYLYLVFKGKVQVRMSVVDYLRNESMAFQRSGFVAEFPNKNWIRLTGPVIKAPGDFLMRGFQGFRYTSLIF
jgi:hypothetical protein